MSDSLRACAPAPPTVFASVDPGTGVDHDPGRAVMSTKLWDVGQYLKYHFLGGTQNQQNAVKTAIATWLTYTNIHLDFDSNPANADIRITFDSKGGSWSAVGTDAKLTDKSKATMNLGWIADNATPSATDLSTCLHELGHALGMMHEHQSPARGERIHLKELAVYNYYRPLLGYNDKLVKSQIIDQYNLSTVSNYSELDLKSIMMYFMPGTLNEEGVDVPPNLALSDLDKAFITLNYPNKTINDGGMKVTTALNIVGAPNDISAKILDFVNKENYTDARTTFSAWNMSVSHLHSINQSFLRTVNPAEAPQAQLGLRDAFGKVFKHPMFKSVVKNVVNGVLQQQGIDTAQSVPGTAPRDTMNTIGAMVINPDFAKVVFDINNQFLPYKPHIFGPGPVQHAAITEKSTHNQDVNFDTTCLFREGLEAARLTGKL